MEELLLTPQEVGPMSWDSTVDTYASSQEDSPAVVPEQPKPRKVRVTRRRCKESRVPHWTTQKTLQESEEFTENFDDADPIALQAAPLQVRSGMSGDRVAGQKRNPANLASAFKAFRNMDEPSDEPSLERSKTRGLWNKTVKSKVLKPMNIASAFKTFRNMDDPNNLLAVPLKGGIWPSPFPGYKGLFTYEVKGESRASDNSLGNGVYLWMMEILAGTVLVTEPTAIDLTCASTDPLLGH